MKFFADMNREQLRALAPSSLAVLPLGATEQHGPHLPTGTDTFTVERIAHEAAAVAGERISVVVGPSLPFGSSDHHLVFGGTLSIGTETYFRVLRELLQSLVTDGFAKIFLLNGHGGNHELAQLAARDIALQQPVSVAGASYWTIAWEDLIAVEAHRGRRLPGHAGDFETSMILSLRPDAVSSELPAREESFDTGPRGFEAPYRREHHGSWTSIDGYTDSPKNASAEKGEQYRKIIVAAVARAFIEFMSPEPGGGHARNGA